MSEEERNKVSNEYICKLEQENKELKSRLEAEKTASNIVTNLQCNAFKQLQQENKELKEKLNLAENILYDYLYKDKKITKEIYDSFKGDK